MKKILLKIIIGILVFTTVIYTNTYIYADDLLEDEIIDVDSKIQDSTPNISDINSRAYVVIDRNSNQVLVGKNENQKRKMASTTKIMTAIIIIENCNLSDIVEISKKSANTGGSRLGLKYQDKISVRDLLHGLMLCSGNDCAVALAEHCAGSIEAFAEKMNQKAIELNLNNSHFVTPHGLDSDEHYTTAYELALLTNYALKNETFSKIVNTLNYTVTINGYGKSIHNTNELLGNLNGVYGVKTGFTNGANRCLVTSCKRNNMDIICVVLGADTKSFRTKDSIKLIEYCFKNFEVIDIKNIVNNSFNEWKNENVKNISVEKSFDSIPEIEITNLKFNTVPIEKSLVDSITCKISCDFNLITPISKDTVIGNIEVRTDKSTITSCDIVIKNEIRKNSVLNYLNYFFENYQDILMDFLGL